MSDNMQINRYMWRFLPESSKRQLVLMTGARQTGKTTLIREKYRELRYINLDAPENRETLRMVSSASWAKDIGPAILDEAQKEPVVFEKVKYSYDDGSVSFSVLSGSSQVLLLKKIRETLAGRVSLYELWPLLMGELMQLDGRKTLSPPMLDRFFSSDGIDAILKDMPSVLLDQEDAHRRKAETHLLQWGGMPALLPLTEEERWKWLADYAYTYLERDLSDLTRISDLVPFRKFQRISALRSGKLLNYSELARDAAVSVDTARRYLEYLRISYQTILLQPYQRNLTSSAVKTPKIYWIDTGILRQLTGFHGEATGEIYETMVFGELMKWMKTSGRQGELFFYRTRSGLELDVLLQSPEGFIGMEIKSRKKLARKDVTAMREVASSLGGDWRGGMVIYQGDQIFRLAEPSIWAVPSRRLFTPEKGYQT